MNDKELIEEARRLENDYGDNYEVMTHMSALADALESVRAERDAALAAIERVRVAKHEVDSVHQIHGADCLCGHSSARSRSRTEHITEAMLAALDGAPEPEANIEYGVLTPERAVWHVTDDLDEARTVAKDNPGDSVEYRHMAGPWLPVEGEKP